MLDQVDLTHPVYWLLAAAALGAVSLLVLGVISTLTFNRKYTTKIQQRQVWAASVVGDFGPLERSIFIIFPITIALLVVYLVLGTLLGLPLL